MSRLLNWKTLNTVLLLLFIGNFGFSQKFQLSSPKVISGPTFFKGSTSFELEFDFEDVEIFYTIDDKISKENYKKYKTPLTIKDDCKVSYYVAHENFNNSDTGSIEYYDISGAIGIKNLDVNPLPHPNYSGNSDSPMDNQKRGSMNFQDGEWLGFKGGDVTFKINLSEDVKEGELLVGILRNSGAWIFGPGKIEVSVYSRQMEKYIELETKHIEAVSEEDNPERLLIPFSFELDEPCSKFKLKLEKISAVPMWHTATVDNSWIFMDEILVR